MSPKRWRKCGLLLDGPHSAPHVRSHAALPVVHQSADGATWVYYSSRDADGRAHVCRSTVGEVEPGKLQAGPTEEVLAPGLLGTFDDAGCTVSCIVNDGDTQHLLYTGWALGQSVPFYLQIGRATSTDGGRTFQRDSHAPLLDRSPEDPYLTASPSVLNMDGQWRMWYVSGVGWDRGADGASRHRYNIRHATSADGLEWHRDGRAVVDFASPTEHSLGRPHVVTNGDGFVMWFCARGSFYELQCAESADGLDWTRVSVPPELSRGPEGWDAEMVCYPFLATIGESQYLLYNGNGYGRSGLGYAVLSAAD